MAETARGELGKLTEAKVNPLKLIHADALQRLQFEPCVEPVAGLIVEGVTLLCGAPKQGKSWLALDLCCAVASGRRFLGRETTSGDVLYLALEDSERRLQSRLLALGEAVTDTLQFSTNAALLENGLLVQLQDWAQHVKNPRLVVIDTLQKIRGATSSRANIYQQDYEAVSKLKQFADKKHVAVVLIHHLSKMREAADPFDRISGSTALSGAADTSILLSRERGSNDAQLLATGRDVFLNDVHLRFERCRWHAVGREIIEREQYEANPIVRTLRTLLNESFGGVLEISSDELREAVAARQKICACGTKEGMTRKLSALAPDLLRFDGVHTEISIHKNRRRINRFAKKGGDS